MKLSLPVGPRDHASGPADAPNTLVEYGDYECTQCVMAYPIMKNVRRHYGDRLLFVFRNFPLTDIHPHAESAAELAEAAASQGKYWEMHDTLFEHLHLEPRDLLGYANQLGLDIARIRTELEQRVYLRRLAEDLASGAQSGVNATPTFFLNGERFDGPWNGPDLVAALEAQIRR